MGKQWPAPLTPSDPASDAAAALLAVARIQFVTEAPAMAVAKGQPAPPHWPGSLARLTADDCAVLAESRLQKNRLMVRQDHSLEYALAVEWFEAAHEYALNLA